jgi:glyoxylase-like metal-dependent hydrolase (beta-lactamase superfamily II)
MSHDGIRVGEVEVSVICEGYAPIDLVEEFPATELDWDAERSAFPWAFHDETSWAWHVHAFALRTPEGLVLIDTGLGTFPPYRPWAASVPRLEALAAANVDPNDVVAVVLTHLHADHAGGAVVDGEPVFPNARYHVHPEDWAFFAAADATDYTGRHVMSVLEERDQLELRRDDHRVVEGVKVIWAPGHTPGHRTVLVTSGDDTALFTGDALHTPPQVRLPDAPSNHDEDPENGSASRERALHDAREHGWLVAVSHFAEPFGRVTQDGWRSEA